MVTGCTPRCSAASAVVSSVGRAANRSAETVGRGTVTPEAVGPARPPERGREWCSSWAGRAYQLSPHGAGGALRDPDKPGGSPNGNPCAGTVRPVAGDVTHLDPAAATTTVTTRRERVDQELLGGSLTLASLRRTTKIIWMGRYAPVAPRQHLGVTRTEALRLREAQAVQHRERDPAREPLGRRVVVHIGALLDHRADVLLDRGVRAGAFSIKSEGGH